MTDSIFTVSLHKSCHIAPLSGREGTTDHYILVLLYLEIIQGSIGTAMGYIALILAYISPWQTPFSLLSLYKSCQMSPVSSSEGTTDDDTLVLTYFGIEQGKMRSVLGYIVLFLAYISLWPHPFPMLSLCKSCQMAPSSSRQGTTDHYILVLLYLEIIQGSIGTAMGYIALILAYIWAWQTPFSRSHCINHVT